MPERITSCIHNEIRIYLCCKRACETEGRSEGSVRIGEAARSRMWAYRNTAIRPRGLRVRQVILREKLRGEARLRGRGERAAQLARSLLLQCKVPAPVSQTTTVTTIPGCCSTRSRSRLSSPLSPPPYSHSSTLLRYVLPVLVRVFAIVNIHRPSRSEVIVKIS